MATGGYGVGGSSTAGPSAMWKWLPWKGYQETGTWLEEFVDAIGSQFSILERRFISATARANLLDPTYTPVDVASSTLATSTAPPTSSAVTDTMLDVLLYIARGQFPVNPKLSTAQKQAIVTLGWDILRRKGTRQRLLNLVSQVTNGPVGGWTTPPYLFGFILPDGAPSPGYGDWTPVPALQTGTVSATSGSATLPGVGTNFLTGWVGYKIIIGSGTNAQIYNIAAVASTTSLTLSAVATATAATQPYYIVPGASVRPWAFDAARSMLGNVFPAWGTAGVGFSQFRAGYSAPGEIVMPSGSRIGLLANDSFSTWSAGLPSTWSTSGAGTVVQAVRVTGTTYEFSDYACRIDLTGAAASVTRSFSQTTAVNDQRPHRVALDYAYTNAQSASVLTVTLQDSSGYYYNVATGSWQATAPVNAVPVSSSRATYSFNVTPQGYSSTVSALVGTATWTVSVTATSDGTATTQTTYDLFRFGVFENYNQTIEATFEGEPLGWWPLIDSIGWETASRAGATAQLVQPESFDRGKVKLVAGTAQEFAYHPALSGKGLRCTSAWTNLAKGSIDFVTDWTAASTTRTLAASISPIVGETVASATTVTGTGGSAQSFFLSQNTGVTPTSKSYMAGVWVKNLTSDTTTSNVELRLSSGSTTFSAFKTVTSAQGWQLVVLPAVTFGGGDVASLLFKPNFYSTNPTAASFALWGAFIYDVTGKTDVLYPPVTISAIGATSSTVVPVVKATAATTDTNVLHPLTQRTMVSTSSGALTFTIVPTFGAASQPNAVIFECSQGSTTSGVYIDISSGSIRLRRRDSASVSTSISLAMTTSAAPTSSQVTWLRDQALTVRARWSADGSMSLGVGASSISAAAVGGWLPVDTSVSKIRFGCDNAGANQFDGIIRDVRSVQLGTPAS